MNKTSEDYIVEEILTTHKTHSAISSLLHESTGYDPSICDTMSRIIYALVQKIYTELPDKKLWIY